MFERNYDNDHMHKGRKTSSTRKVTNYNKADSKKLKDILYLLPSLLEKEMFSNSEDLLFSKHLVSFLVILTGGTTFVCEVRLSFKYSNGRLTNVILNDVWTAPSPKEKKRKTFVEAPTYYKATCSEFPQTVNPQVSLPF